MSVLMAVHPCCHLGTEAVPASLSAFLGCSCPGHPLLQPRCFPAKGPSAPQWMARQETQGILQYNLVWTTTEIKWDFIFQRKMLWIFVPKSKLRQSFYEINNYEYVLILKTWLFTDENIIQKSLGVPDHHSELFWHNQQHRRYSPEKKANHLYSWD